MAGYDVRVFDLDGGRLCLDFANTLSASDGDLLLAYADLVTFAEESHLVTPDDAQWLRETAPRYAGDAEAAMQDAYTLRAAIYATFSAVANGGGPDAEDLAMLNYAVAAAMAHARVVRDGDGGYRWGWDAQLQLGTPLWEIARSAAELLISPEDRGRVRQCGGAGCRWLFLDTSKNRSRQWCSMRSCGNRQKARRHYQRVRTLRDA